MKKKCTPSKNLKFKRKYIKGEREMEGVKEWYR
jgi:hypothetical protein